MKKEYPGLEVKMILFERNDQIVASPGPNCFATVTLVMKDMICVSPEEFREIEWYGLDDGRV